MEKCRLLVVEEAVSSAASTGSDVYGFVRPAEGLVQVLAVDPITLPRGERLGTVSKETAEGSVAIQVAGETLHFVPSGNVPAVGSIEVMTLASLDTRRAGILGESALAGKRVGLVGCGSLGSAIAVELARAGVGGFLLADPGYMDVTNVSRHACGIVDVGRPKALALGELLGQRAASATPIVSDLADADSLAALSRTDLLVVATDSPRVQFQMNEFALDHELPAVFPQAYERACGGEVFVLTPGQGPCLYCATGFRAEVAGGLSPAVGGQAYQAADANQLVAEPGLGVDISYLAAVAASYVLATLMPSGSRGTLREDGRYLVLVHGGSKPQGDFAELFRKPFEHLAVRVTRPEPCPVCGWKSGGEEETHVTR
jgi:hypothetical protein